MSSQGRKGKSGIPVTRPTSKNREVPVKDCIQTLHISGHDGRVKSQLPIYNPLAMAKKSAVEQKQTSVETWADEKIESQSQKMSIYSQSERRRRREDMEKQLQEAEAQLVILNNLLEKREKLIKAKEEEEKKEAELEQKLAVQDGFLIEHEIDPATGEKIVPDEDGEKKVESTQKITKKRIQEMREKLRAMNQKTESYLADVENTLQYLDSLQLASARAGPVSEETQSFFSESSSEENSISKFYRENKESTKSASRHTSSGDKISGTDNEIASHIFITNAGCVENGEREGTNMGDKHFETDDNSCVLK